MREITDISKNWKCFSGEPKNGKEPKKPAFGWKKSELPAPHEADFSGKLYCGQTVYVPYSRTNLFFAELFGEKGVKYSLSVNGQNVGEHTGASKAFRFEITPYLKDEKAVLFLKADYAEADRDASVRSEAAFDEAFHKAVILKVAPTHFDLSADGSCGLSVKAEKKEDGADIYVSAVIENPVSGRRVRFEAAGVTVEAPQTEPEATLRIPSSDEAKTYTVSASLLEGGEATDRVAMEITV